jgi:hypothetical protein
MSLPAQTFDTVSPAKFAAACLKVQQLTGVAVPAQSGTVTGRGFTVKLTYDPAAQTLTVEVLSKPLLVLGSLVQDKIRNLVQNA